MAGETRRPDEERMHLMSIGDFARAAGLTAKALRLYDELGLLEPAEVDPRNGYRFYDPSQLDAARLVAALRRVGMPLGRIRTVVALPAPAAAAELTSYWRQVEADVRSRRSAVADLVSTLRRTETPMTINETPRVAVACASGQGARDQMQDAVHLGRQVWAVADGFGESDQASRTLAAALAEAPDPLDADGWDALAAAAAGALSGSDPHTGSTLTGISLRGDVATVAHVGDSRAWLIRDGVLRQLTVDHTEVASLLDQGALSEEEARLHPRRAVLNRAVASGVPAEPDVTGLTVQPGDRLVLTTDGVHALFSGERLAQLLSGSPEEAVTAVADATRDAGEPDNWAVVVVDPFS